MTQKPSLEALLDRPVSERCREHRYRFGQAMVFGLPVIALDIWGSRLGGPESPRWVGIFQALLAGWVLYTGAAGMLFEGLMQWTLRRRISADCVAGLLAFAAYFPSITAVIATLAGVDIPQRPIFHWSVLIIALWCGARWWWLR